MTLDLGDGGLVPTRVGMILIEVKPEEEMQACPHTRGDDPQIAVMR